MLCAPYYHALVYLFIFIVYQIINYVASTQATCTSNIEEKLAISQLVSIYIITVIIKHNSKYALCNGYVGDGITTIGERGDRF